MKKALVIIVALLVGVVFASAGFAQDKVNLPTAIPPSAGAPEKVGAPDKATPEKKVKKTTKTKSKKTKKKASDKQFPKSPEVD
ncbi:MAG: hypothetical protein BWX92_01004 [Deltaproteobacteria bacterium ADurb.Bin135]|nr:MAG: hypothetical protein BWX92_01004 [Deltaproteobacteria bacterium ADurb.Bin135]